MAWSKYTTEFFVERARLIHGEKFDYSLSSYNGANRKIKIICPEHGEFEQIASAHLMGKDCLSCRKDKYRSSTNSFIKKAKQIHGTKYCYSKTDYKTNQDKVVIKCPEHGNFKQAPKNHLNGSGCPSCGKDISGLGRSNKKEFINKAREVHGDKYSYNKVDYRNRKTNVLITCPIHGNFKQSPNKHLLGQNCPKCSPKWEKYDTETFIKKSKEKHGDKYDYSESEYTNSKTKVRIICPEHGAFWQIPKSHFLNGCGCKKCGTKSAQESQKMTMNQFLSRAKSIHGDAHSYKKVNYKTAREKVIITCNKHGDFEIAPDTYLNAKVGCFKCKASTGENKIREFLNKIGAQFEEQYSFDDCRSVRPLPFDFRLDDLLIEYQGEQHYHPVATFGGKDSFLKQQKRDQIKRDYCKKNRYQLLEIKYNDKMWREKIEEALFNYLI